MDLYATARPVTLIDAAFPVNNASRRIARDVALIVGFSLFVALCAQIAVRLPWTTVPVTGQTFAVLVTGGALGAWRGASALTVYMLMGMVGIPVFTPDSSVTAGAWDAHFILPWSGNHGLLWEFSSGGYILGFIPAAALVGYLAERQWDRKPWIHLGMLLGNIVVYVPGVLWLAYLIGTGWVHPVGQPLGELIAGTGTWDKALKGGLYPFIVGDLMKLFLASMALPSAWALISLRDQRRGKREGGAWT